MDAFEHGGPLAFRGRLELRSPHASTELGKICPHPSALSATRLWLRRLQTSLGADQSCVCTIEKLSETGKLSLCRGRALCDTVSLR